MAPSRLTQIEQQVDLIEGLEDDSMLQQRFPDDFGKDFTVDPISLDVEMTSPQVGAESVKERHRLPPSSGYACRDRQIAGRLLRVSRVLRQLRRSVSTLEWDSAASIPLVAIMIGSRLECPIAARSRNPNHAVTQ